MKIWKKLFTADRLFIFLLLLAVLLFFYPFIFFGRVPLPADTIVGMYHPFRDNVWSGYSAGVPYKNYLVTDPVRQQYVWRVLAMEQFAKGELPLWNPYAFSGTPLLANFQSAVFYPLNALFFLFAKNTAWGILVLLQPLLGGIFLYLFLRHIKVSPVSSFFGAFVFAFSGFSIAWLEWNTVIHTILWLPLILLSIEKVMLYLSNNSKFKWLFIFVFSLVSSFFAGHLQVFFYSFFVLSAYLTLKILILGKNKLKAILLFAACYLLFAVITSVQWLPTMQFISLSARSVDQGSWQKDGWFIPWQNLVQFIAPDFFGNPATGNYWGVWNYGEFVGYIGIIPLIFALYAVFFLRDKKTQFFVASSVIGLIMALPTLPAKLPYILEVPFLSSSQPTRLLSIIGFSLSILAAFGLDKFVKERSDKKMIFIFITLGILLGLLWIAVLTSNLLPAEILPDQKSIAIRNLILPTFFFLMLLFFALPHFLHKNNKFFKAVLCVIVFLSVADLFRFGWKFTPFSDSSWIFPNTRILKKLSASSAGFKIMSQDRRIMPPNFSVAYKLADVSGYDPLYLSNYGQLVSSWENNRATFGPAPFNRIITPQNYQSFLTDFIGVKYILSLVPLKSEKLVLLEQENSTYLYENIEAYPKAYFAEKVERVEGEDEVLIKIFELGNGLRETAVISEDLEIEERSLDTSESAEIIKYSENYVIINTESRTKRLLVLTDAYYPSWKVLIDGSEDRIIKTDYIFRGVVVPEGEHTVKFEATIL